MDVLILARWQFAVTTIYHFFFVPLTLGLSIFVAILETAYVRTGKDVYKRMTKFWGKLFLINFAMGVVTGIVQEFQFGMNWSEYSRFVGDIFGAPLAIEALLAFFLESTFLGIWIFGWDRLSKKLHAATMWLVAIGSNLSALWILIANSFMQEPQGYRLVTNAAGEVVRAEMADFWALVFNPHVWVQFPHVITSGIATAGFFVIAISTYHIWKRSKDQDAYQKSLKISSVYAFIGVLLAVLIGHTQMQHMMKVQPMKVAAAEALWDTEDPASLSLFTVGDEEERKDIFAIRVPRLLSILAFNSVDGTVRGINDIQAEYVQKYGPGNYVPPVAISYWSFRIMVGAGVLMVFISLYVIFLVLRDRFDFKPWLIKILLLSLTLPYLANSTGWILAEVGRQPWIVFGLLKTQDAVSPAVAVSAGEVLTSLILFTLVYGILMVVDVYLLKKYAIAGTTYTEDHEE
ncbi:MAG: cytochrome ubiquinol oxidase subunit I [Caldithrix sp.]|nr:cytochrome ubiquinol oxidase subunit I [Caldithrix sp.]